MCFDISHVYGRKKKKTGGGHAHITLKNDHKKGLDHICQVINIKNIQYLGVSCISSPFYGRFDNVLFLWNNDDILGLWSCPPG